MYEIENALKFATLYSRADFGKKGYWFFFQLCLVNSTASHGNTITQEIPSLFLSVKFFIFLMTPIDSTNDQNICAELLRLHLHIND